MVKLVMTVLGFLRSITPLLMKVKVFDPIEAFLSDGSIPTVPLLLNTLFDARLPVSVKEPKFCIPPLIAPDANTAPLFIKPPLIVPVVVSLPLFVKPAAVMLPLLLNVPKFAKGDPAILIDPDRSTFSVPPEARVMGPLVLLCHKLARWQQGQRGKRRAMLRASLIRIVAIDALMWRSARIGGSAGSITRG